MTKEAKNIIESGDLDLYALGLLEEIRVAGVEQVLADDAELRSVLTRIRNSFEEYASLHAEEPVASLRNTIIDSAFAADNSINDSMKKSASVLELPVSRITYRYAVAASVAFIMSTSAAVYFWSQGRIFEQQLTQAQSEIVSMRSEQNVMAAKLDMHDKHIIMDLDENTMKVPLKAQAAAPAGTNSMVMWNKVTHDVYLLPASLPANHMETDYQLWALVDGKPIDLGIYNTSSGMSMTQMKSIERVDAFAITLEPKGGSVAPTLAQLFVMGKASS